MSERYPSYYSSTALMSIMGTVQAFVFALCMERDWSQWKLGWNIRLLTVSYSVRLNGSLIVVSDRINAYNCWFECMSSRVLGNRGLWNHGDIHCMVRAHERPFVCLCLQPSDAYFGCHHGVSNTGWNVAPWKVSILIQFIIYSISMNQTWNFSSN